MASAAYDGTLQTKLEELFTDLGTIELPLAMLYDTGEVSEEDTEKAIRGLRVGGLALQNYEPKVLTCEDVQDSYYVASMDEENSIVRHSERSWHVPITRMHVEFTDSDVTPVPVSSIQDTYGEIRKMLLKKVAQVVGRRKEKFVVVGDRIWVTVRSQETYPLKFELRIRVPVGNWEN